MFNNFLGRSLATTAALAVGASAAFSEVPGLVSVTIGTDSIVGSFKTQATVKLDRAADPGGTTVLLSSDNPVKMIVTSSTIVQEGKRNKSFNVITASVLSDTVCTLSATVDSATFVTDTLTVTPGGLSDMACDSPIAQNGSGNGQVWLTAITPTDLDVDLRSSNPSVASVPATVTVPGGDRFSPNFAITTGAVGVDTVVTIRARLGNSIRTESVLVKIPVVALTIHVQKNDRSDRNGCLVTAHYFGGGTESVTTGIDGLAVFTSPVAGAGTFDTDSPGTANDTTGNAMTVDAFSPTLIEFIEP